MTNEKILLKSESSKTLTEISNFLRTLADKIQSGNLVLKQDDNEVNLSLPQNCVLEVKVEEEQKGDVKKYQVEVEIEWKEGEENKELEIV